MQNLILIFSTIVLIFMSFGFQNFQTNNTYFKAMQNEDKLIHLPKNWKDGETKCPLHKEILKKDEIYITYGEVDGIPNYYEARTKSFPFANTSYLGGCIVQKEKIAVVAFCEKCRKAEKAWIAGNKRK